MKNLNEMFVAFIAVLFISVVAQAATLISYDDGSTYTVADNEEVYVSDGELFDKRTYYNGSVHFKLKTPNEKRDYVDRVTTTAEFGTHEWCESIDPDTAVGSFAYVNFLKMCDTNKDGNYGCGDSLFDASDDSSVCPSS